MFSIFTYIMSRVTHSEPGLPMKKPTEFERKSRRRTIQNVCLVTRQSFNEGSLDTRTWKHGTFAFACVEAIDQRKLVAKREFNNPMDKHAVKAVKGDETVSHLPHKFSRIAWYFLARGAEISVKEIDRRRCLIFIY